MIIGQDKPDLDSLSHFGVKGMRWGVRKTKTSDSDIKNARARMDVIGAKYQVANRAVKSTKKGTKERASAQAKADRIKADYLRNPDRPTAMLMTRGEKFITVLGGTLIAPGVGTAAGIARIGVTNAASGRVAAKQAAGAYNKK